MKPGQLITDFSDVFGSLVEYIVVPSPPPNEYLRLMRLHSSYYIGRQWGEFDAGITVRTESNWSVEVWRSAPQVREVEMSWKAVWVIAIVKMRFHVLGGSGAGIYPNES